MDNCTGSYVTAVPVIPEQRRNIRFTACQLITVHTFGAGKVTNIGRGGLSFGCLYRHEFPQKWTMDLLNAKGSHIKNLQVRKVWEVVETGALNIPDFEIEIGVEFVELSLMQSRDLNSVHS